MNDTEIECAVLLADITGSTPLYEALGDGEAARRISRSVDTMRSVVETHGGSFVSAKGDDVLATFEVADQALKAVEEIMAEVPLGGLSVHAGLHFGRVISTRGDIFGDAVNITARLAGLANPGEVLISRDLADRLPPERSRGLRPLNAMTFKGKSMALDVFSLAADTQFPEEAGTHARTKAAAGAISVTVSFEGGEWLVSEGVSITIGRSPDNDLVIERPWVSRRHASIAVSGGRVELTDRSSYGSYLKIGDAGELMARRETVIITGGGSLSPGASLSNPDAAVIQLQLTTV